MIPFDLKPLFDGLSETAGKPLAIILFAVPAVAVAALFGKAVYDLWRLR